MRIWRQVGGSKSKRILQFGAALSKCCIDTLGELLFVAGSGLEVINRRQARFFDGRRNERKQAIDPDFRCFDKFDIDAEILPHRQLGGCQHDVQLLAGHSRQTSVDGLNVANLNRGAGFDGRNGRFLPFVGDLTLATEEQDDKRDADAFYGQVISGIVVDGE